MKKYIYLIQIVVLAIVHSCTVPGNVDLIVDFKNKDLTVEYSNFYSPRNKSKFSCIHDSILEKKYKESDLCLFQGVSMVKDYYDVLAETDMYLDDDDTSIMKLELETKSRKKVNGELKYKYHFKMLYDSISNDHIAEVISTSGYNLGCLNDEFLLFYPIEDENVRIKSNGNEIRTKKNIIYYWPDTTRLFKINIITDVDTAQYYTKEMYSFFDDEGKFKAGSIPKDVFPDSSKLKK